MGNGAAPLVLLNIRVPKNGYCLVYVSNESQLPVYFDNLQVRHDRGRILEENHYYAYGLKIAALSSRAFGGTPNNYQYQGDYSEFDDDLGWNDFLLRSYDPQLGRFLQHDPYDQFASGYVGMGNDPGNVVDPTGGWIGDKPDDKPGKLYRSRDAAAWGWARYYIRESLDNNVEISSIIYEVMCDGKKYYGFTEGVKSPRVKERYHESPGAFHFLNKKTDKDYDPKWDFSYVVPQGSKIVAHIHSHGGENGNKGNISASPDDRKNISKYSELYFYLLNFGGELRKYQDSYTYDWKTGKTIVKGLYRGRNPKNITLNNGDGQKNGEFDDGKHLTDPIKDAFMFGNAHGSKMVSNQQAVNMGIQLGKMVASGVRLATATQKVISTATGIPCPKF
jgi:RHS repeat-associated protein